MALFDQDRHLHTGIAGGRVIVAADGRVTAFAEGAQAGSSLVNAGVYLVEPSVLEFIPSDRPSDFGRDVFPAMLAQDRVLLGHVMDDQGYCLGLDTPESYAAGLRLSADARLVMS
jgi:NDP-sugar pyrophosphorylase family protein